MPAEQAEAHLIRLERLLADLEQAATSLADASWGASGEAHTARYLPGDSRQTVIEWADRIRTKLAEVAVLGDVADCPF